jgi:hypothetical protein
MNERKEREGRILRETDTFSALKVPRQCPLVLLVKVGLSEEGRAMRS